MRRLRDGWWDFQGWVATHKIECFLIMAALLVALSRPFG